MARPFKCPYCGANRTVSKGYRLTKTMGKRRLRRCKECGRKFTPRNQLSVNSEQAPVPESDIKPEYVTDLAENLKLLPNTSQQPEE